MNRETALIIVTFNSAQDLFACLSSLENVKTPFRLFVIDNASTDKSVRIVQKLKKLNPKIVVNKTNVGFVAAANQGVKLAKQDPKIKFFILLNPDTIVRPNFLSAMIAVAKKDTVGLVQPKILLKDNPNLINTIGNSIHFLGFSFCQNFRQKNREFKNQEIPAVSGACFLMKKEVLDKIGGFNPLFWMYYEDTEISWRTKLAGYKIYLAADAIIYHTYNFKINHRKFFELEKNRLIVFFSNFQLKTKILLLPAIILGELAMCFFAIKNKCLRAKLQSYWWIAKNWQKIIAQQKQIDKIRQLSDRQLANYFKTKIEFADLKSKYLNWILNLLLANWWKLIKKVL